MLKATTLYWVPPFIEREQSNLTHNTANTIVEREQGNLTNNTANY